MVEQKTVNCGWCGKPIPRANRAAVRARIKNSISGLIFCDKWNCYFAWQGEQGRLRREKNNKKGD